MTRDLQAKAEKLAERLLLSPNLSRWSEHIEASLSDAYRLALLEAAERLRESGPVLPNRSADEVAQWLRSRADTLEQTESRG